MKIQIHVKTSARHEKVEDLGDGTFRVAVKAPSQEGKANQAILAIVADHFSVPKSAVAIVSGHKSKRKWIKIRK